MSRRYSDDRFHSYVDKFYEVYKNRPAQNDESPDFPLLKGEIICSHCDNVHLRIPFEEEQFGKLYCTSFRICFVPFAKHRDPCCSRSLIFTSDYQVPLCSVATLYYSSMAIGAGRFNSARKFRQMTSPISQLELVSYLRIYIKDFRVWSLDLRKSQLAVNLTNNIYHFSRPASLSNFFQLSCEDVRSRKIGLYEIAYNNRNDWLSEMRRCHLSEQQWRVCFLSCDRSGYRASVPSYPFCVVVPGDLYDVSVYGSLIPSWNHGRFPVWCWSSANGSVLMRSSACKKDLNAQEMWESVLLPVCQAHPRTRRPQIVECDIDPSSIVSSYEKLRELCSFETSNRFFEKEKDWNTHVDNSGWYALVFKLLKITRKVLHKILDSQRSVIVYDVDGFNAAAVVSSLVQICADSNFRTIGGLYNLIDKEWIALGHPFGTNLFNCSFYSSLNQPRTCVATFLAFLDCLYQLIRLHPLSFEYSQYMLIALWDLAISGIAPGLTCNSVSDRLALNRTAPTFPLTQYYTSKYCQLFSNVMYSANILLGIDSNTVIRPSSSPVDVEFWNDCYLRWLQPVLINEGGCLTKDLALSSILSSAASVAQPNCTSIIWRQRLHPAFEKPSISSAYPYTEASDRFVMEKLSIGAGSTRSERDSLGSLDESGLLNVERRLSAVSLSASLTELSQVFRAKNTCKNRAQKRNHSPSGTLV